MLSRACSPMLGSSSTYRTPARFVPSWAARRMRWASPLRQRLCRPVEREGVAQPHVPHEPQALADLGDDVAHVTSRPRSSRSKAFKARDQLRGGKCEERGARRGVPLFPLKWSLTARDTRFSRSPRQSGQGGRPPSSLSHRPRRGPAGAGARCSRPFSRRRARANPRVDPAVAPGRWGAPPTPRRVEGKVLRVELREGFARLGCPGPRGGEPGKDLARGGRQEARTLPRPCRASSSAGPGRGVPLQVGHDRLDIVLVAVPVELLEGLPVRITPSRRRA